MIGIAVVDASEVPPGDAWLSADERRALADLRVPKRRDDWRMGRFAARLAVAAALGVPATRVSVRPAPDGAPQALVDGGPAALTISISHCAGTAACLAAEPPHPAGCDLERVEPRPAVFVRDWFLPAEQDLVAASLAEEQNRVVTVIWSAKESALKALRCGLRRDTRSVAVRLLEHCVDGAYALEVRDLETGGGLHGWWRDVGSDLVLTSVTAEPSPPPEELRRGRPRPRSGGAGRSGAGPRTNGDALGDERPLGAGTPLPTLVTRPFHPTRERLEAVQQTPEPILLIVDPEGDEPTDWCSGPDAKGQCPRAVAGQPVPCAGRELVAVHGDMGPMSRRMVCAREDECPLPIMLAGGG